MKARQSEQAKKIFTDEKLSRKILSRIASGETNFVENKISIIKL
jgi:hypothetical protein